MNHEFHEHEHSERAEHGSRSRSPRARRSPNGHFSGRDDFGRGEFRHRSRRLRRGDVRAAVLVLLEESERNGYQIIQELSDRSNGAWRPSPGSVYPILQQLEDEGLIEVGSTESGRSFHLTLEGRTLVETDREKLGKPWETAADGISGTTFELFGSLKQLAMAVRQVASAGNEAQTQRAASALTEARRAIYRILAEDES